MRRKPHDPITAAAGCVMAAILASSCSMTPARAADAKEAAPAMQATLELLRTFSYAGDPLLVRLAVFNTGESPWANATGVNLLGGLRVSGPSGGRVSLKVKEALDSKEQPAVLAPGGFFGVITDVQPLSAEFSKPGTYTFTWEAGGMRAEAVSIRVIPRFEPEADYVAVIETDFGYLEFDLLEKEAPKHVQNFFDLAHQGFYNGSAIHMVMKGVEFRGGDTSTSPLGRPFYTLSPEVPKERKHQRGTLSMMRLQGAGVDDGSQFVVTLGPTSQYDGVLSVFGALTSGEEALAAIENIPTSGRSEAPYYRPLRPIVLRSVAVKKAGEKGAAGGAR